MKNKLMLIMLLGILLIGNVIAFECDGTYLGTFNKGTNITLKQTCDTCTYVTLDSITYPNSSLVSINENMSKLVTSYTYIFFTDEQGNYGYSVFGNKDGVIASENFCFRVGDEFAFWFIIIGTVLAIIFFIASLVTPEEFFVYISGTLFIIEGVYIMINGFSLMNNANTRMIAIIYLGVGLLFTVGAYIFNWLSESNNEDDSEEEEY